MHSSEIGATLDCLTAKLFADENHAVWCVAAYSYTRCRDGIALTPWQCINPHHGRWEMVTALPTVLQHLRNQPCASLCLALDTSAPISPRQGQRYLQVCGIVHLRNLKYPVNTDYFLNSPELNPTAAGASGNLPIDLRQNWTGDVSVIDK